METGVAILISSVLITFILLAFLIALSFRLTEKSTESKKVSSDLKKIKKQIEGPDK